MEKILQQILHEIKDMRSDMTNFQTDITSMKSDITGLQTDITSMKSDITGLQIDITSMKSDMTSMRTDIADLKQGQLRLEAGQEKLQQNLVDSLGLYTDKIVDYVDVKTEVLNKRVYKVEADIEQLSRQ